MLRSCLYNDNTIFDDDIDMIRNLFEGQINPIRKTSFEIQGRRLFEFWKTCIYKLKKKFIDKIRKDDDGKDG